MILNILLWLVEVEEVAQLLELVQEAGVEVLNRPFFARGNVATAGGCLASPYLAAWVLARLHGLDAAREALHYVAPVGEKDAYVARALQHIETSA